MTGVTALGTCRVHLVSSAGRPHLEPVSPTSPAAGEQMAVKKPVAETVHVSGS